MKLRPFELTLVIIFSGLALAALALLASYKSTPSNDDPELAQIGVVRIWGTIPASGVNKVLLDLTKENDAYSNVVYKYIAPAIFYDSLQKALADQAGPDLVLVSQEKLVKLRGWIQPFPYESMPVSSIRSAYIDGAQVFALSDGFFGFPVAVDPLVMYWNKDILTNKGYLDAPETWESLVNTMFPDLIERDFKRTITKSVVAMGEYSNINNAFGIISALMLQGGSEGVTEVSGSNYTVRLQSSLTGKGDPLQSALNFYTQFSQSSNSLYSWNRSFAQDRQKFIAEDLALYFGYLSEGVQIEKINPNLNFDIAEIPQGEGATVRRTYGKFYALSLLKSSDNLTGAAVIVSKLGAEDIAAKIAINSRMVPTNRSSVSRGSTDTYGVIGFKAAPVAYGWLNPDVKKVNIIFETMTKDVNENRSDAGGAASDAAYRLSETF